MCPSAHSLDSSPFLLPVLILLLRSTRLSPLEHSGFSSGLHTTRLCQPGDVHACLSSLSLIPAGPSPFARFSQMPHLPSPLCWSLSPVLSFLYPSLTVPKSPFPRLQPYPGQTDRQTDRDTHTHRQTDTHTDGTQTDTHRQTDTQTDRHTDTHTQTDTHTRTPFTLTPLSYICDNVCTPDILYVCKQIR